MSEKTVNKNTKDLKGIVLKAFEGANNEVRSLGGISREVHIPKVKVMEFLESNPDLFRKADIAPSGIVLYQKVEPAEQNA